MIQAVPSSAFETDIQAVAEGKLVVLHRWTHEMLLILSYDD
jgi:hypothetical protein